MSLPSQMLLPPVDDQAFPGSFGERSLRSFDVQGVAQCCLDDLSFVQNAMEHFWGESF